MEIINLMPELVAHCSLINDEIRRVNIALKNATTPQQKEAITLRLKTWEAILSSAVDIVKLAKKQKEDLTMSKLMRTLELTRCSEEDFEAYKARYKYRQKNNLPLPQLPLSTNN